MLLLIGLTLLVFGRSIKFDFVGLDDDLHLVANPMFHPLTAEHVLDFWKAPYRGEYVPLTYMAWVPVVHFGRLQTPDPVEGDLNPYLFHLLNVAIHVAAVLLAWRVLLRVVTNRWAAAAGAAVFAVHPLHVEAVAWVSSCKDVLSGALALAAVLLYLRFAEQESWLEYAAALFCFALALLSKATVCVTPAVVALLLMIAPSKNRRRAIVWLWPWCAIVLPLVWWTRNAQTDAALLTWSPLWARPLEALDAVAFYFGKLFWPVNLAIDYGRTPRWVIDHRSAWVLWPLPILIVAAAILWRRWRWGWVGIAIFVVALLPVLGFVPFEFQAFSTVADRYTYLPLFGIAIVFAGLLNRATLKRGGVAAAAVVLVLSVIAFVQTGVWASSDTLFQHAVDVQPRAGFGWQGLANVRGRDGDWAGAVEAYRHALEIRPDDLQSMTGLAGAYTQLGDLPNFIRARNAMSYEAARRVLLKDPNSEIAKRRLRQAESQDSP